MISSVKALGNLQCVKSNGLPGLHRGQFLQIIQSGTQLEEFLEQGQWEVDVHVMMVVQRHSTDNAKIVKILITLRALKRHKHHSTFEIWKTT